MRDEEGTELASYEDARHEAIAMLPQIARDRMPDGERQFFAVTVRDGRDQLVYRATLTFHGQRLTVRTS